MADDVIKTSDIIQDDGNLERIAEELEQLSKSYEEMLSNLQDGARKYAASVEKLSASTAEGKKHIVSAALAASKLKEAEDELAFSMSETGQQIAWLKAQTADVNKATVAQQREVNSAVGSYNRLNAELKKNVEEYKSLSGEQLADTENTKKLIDTILNLKSQLKELNDNIRLVIESKAEEQKLDERIAFLQTEEGKRIIEKKKQIRELTHGRKKEADSVDSVARAQQKLGIAQSDENAKLQFYNSEIQVANRLAKNQEIVARSATGSFEQLSAQYEINMIKLQRMSAAELEAARGEDGLVQQTKELYHQLRMFDEETGNVHTFRNLGRTWNGLGFSVAQVVRELPAATISLNTFFLAISNNVPILIDEIDKVREKNALLVKEGKPTVNIGKEIAKSIFSWQTALIVLLTAFSMYGKEIINWIGSLFRAKDAIISLTKATRNVVKELKQSNNSYGSNAVKLQELSEKWQNLSTTAEKQRWIKDNISEFNSLGIAVDSVRDAEVAFVKNTDTVIKALQLRAKATAANKLAAEQYEKAFEKQAKHAVKIQRQQEKVDKLAAKKTPEERAAAEAAVANYLQPDSGISYSGLNRLEKQMVKLAELNATIETIGENFEKTGDQYFEMSTGFTTEADDLLKSLDLFGKASTETANRIKDLADQINNMLLRVRKKYNDSLEAIQRDEFEQRKRQAKDAADEQIQELENIYDKNRRILENENGKYNELTAEQREKILAAQEDIRVSQEAIAMQLSYDLQQIEIDKQIKLLEIQKDTEELRLKVVEKSTKAEIAARLRVLEIEKQIALLQNKKLQPYEQQEPEDITADYEKQAALEAGKAALEAADQQRELETAKFNVVKHSEKERTLFTLKQEKQRLEDQINLAEAGMLEWSQVQIDAAKATIKGIEREIKETESFINRIAEQGFGGALLEALGFNDEQIKAIDSWFDAIIDNISQLIDAEVEVAKAAVETAKTRVEAAKQVYDFEQEARANGYANNVEYARRELEQERRRQKEKEKLLAEAQKRQEAIDTISQVDSLTTAAAQLWKAFSPIPVLGPALALAAITTMFGSFVAAKAKARQVAATQDTYGEGGLEFLEGGSHASGNDIDLHTKNKRGHNMRAEGGEALAVINRRSTRKYRTKLPAIVESLNKGTFEERYLNAFESGEKIQTQINNNIASIDLTKLETSVDAIRKQSDTRQYALPDGTIVQKSRNSTRIIHKC